MFAGLASPTHLIVVLLLVLLLFGAKRIPELAKGLGTGIKELREGISTSDDAKAEAKAPESGKGRSGAHAETVQTVGAHAGQRGL